MFGGTKFAARRRIGCHVAGISWSRRGLSSDNAGIPKRRRAGFSSGPVENKIFLPRCGAADSRLHTHSNRVLHLTNAHTLTDALSPTSHQYWGQGHAGNATSAWSREKKP